MGSGSGQRERAVDGLEAGGSVLSLRDRHDLGSDEGEEEGEGDRRSREVDSPEHRRHLLPLYQPVTTARLAVLLGKEAALLRLVVEGVLLKPLGDRRPAQLVRVRVRVRVEGEG